MIRCSFFMCRGVLLILKVINWFSVFLGVATKVHLVLAVLFDNSPEGFMYCP